MYLFIQEPDGTRTRLPECSDGRSNTGWWTPSCLTDPDGPICKRHREFFRNRKVARDRL